MRIGIDVRALAEGRTTGVQVYIVKLLHALFEVDSKNEYILFVNSYRDITERLPRFDYPNVSLKVFRYPNKIFNFFQKYFKFPKVDKMLGGLDLFFSPHWRLLALSRSVPLVVTFHDLSFEVTPEFFTLRQRVWHRLMNYRLAAKNASKIIAVSESTKTDIKKLYQVPEEKIEVVYSGVEVERFADKRDEKLPEKYFLHFATFEPRKNIFNVIECYSSYIKKSNRRIPLILAGSSGWKTGFEIPDELKDKIIIFKNVSEEQKYQLYKNAFAVLFVSYYEGFGFPVLEAGRHGIPVISSFATSLAEVGKEFALYVNPFRPNQIAEAMIQIEKDKKLRDTMVSKGLEVSEKFSWDAAANKTLKIFNEFV